MLSQHPKAGFFYQKQPLRVPEERNVRPCEELALPQPTKFGFRSQEDEQTSCTTSRLTLVLSMRERARLGLVIRLRVNICQLLRNTTFRGHNSEADQTLSARLPGVGVATPDYPNVWQAFCTEIEFLVRHPSGRYYEIIDAEWEVADDVIVTAAEPRSLLHHPRPTTRQL